MNVNIDNLVSITDANQNFSKVARLVDENGSVVILKNNRPKYVIMNFDVADEEEIVSDESLDAISKRLLLKNKEAYKRLAQ